MPVLNTEVADIFRKVADLLEIEAAGDILNTRSWEDLRDCLKR